jgi:hypothetical protein
VLRLLCLNGRTPALPRLRPDAAALPVPLDDEVQPQLEDLVVAGARVRVRERVARGGELLKEPSRDRDVDPGQLGGEWLDVRAAPRTRCRSRVRL